MAKARWLLVLLMGGALAVLFTLIPGREPAPKETVQEVDPVDLQLLSFDPWAVSAVVIHQRDGGTLRLRRVSVRDSARAPDGVGTGSDPDVAAIVSEEDAEMLWELAEPVTAAADSALITAAVMDLADLRAYRRIDTDDEEIDFAAFGLDPPRGRLEVHLAAASGAAPVILVGEPTPIMIGEHPTWYVRLPDQDDVFAAGGPGLALVDVTADDLLPKRDSLDDDVPAQGDVHD